jgi:hypothetical protein
LDNKAGQFIQPRGASGMATLQYVKMPDNLRVFVPDPDGQDSYPMVTFSWLLVYKHYDDQHKAAALKHDLTWCLTEGQAFNEALGSLRLASQVSTRAMTAVDSIREAGACSPGRWRPLAWTCKPSSSLCVPCSTRGEWFTSGEGPLHPARPQASRLTNTPRTLAGIGGVVDTRMGLRATRVMRVRKVRGVRSMCCVWRVPGPCASGAR